MKLRPAGFEPPYPAWGPELAEHVDFVQAQVGVQRRRADAESETAAAHLRTELGQAAGLRGVEWATHEPTPAPPEQIAITYWHTADHLERWLGGPFVAFVENNAVGGTGIWCESIVAPRSHYETQGSTPDARWGLSGHFPKRLETDHAYWGAMRDRIAAAEDGGLPGTIESVDRQPTREGGGWSIEIPAGTTLIRTVQGYSTSSNAEVDAYQSDLRPQYTAGVSYLIEHPVESRCLTARLLRDHAPGAGLPDTETIAWFTSLADLEAWVHHHPTHATIFAAAQHHSVRFAPHMRLLLGHEVAVVPRGGARACYVECDPQTGLLPWLPSTAM